MTQQPTYYWNGNQYIWDRLRPFNSGLARDLKMLYEWDLEHPGEFVYYPRLCIEKDEIQSHEVAKLPIWGMAEHENSLNDNGTQACRYRILDWGKRVYNNEVQFPYDYWMSDQSLNHEYGRLVYFHEVENNQFNVRGLRKLHLRQLPRGEDPDTSPPPGGSPIPLNPVPPQPNSPSGSELPPNLRERLAQMSNRKTG